ncbi:tripartite tricarboxylate transporter substrate binding protein [Ramlibacter sp. AW1]|uniref:Tripartite tricarboxylate transporter substrate binding protein n=1 Tax=Ramlibacter aurantiacus TaxID=2801330 RepID=A0A937D1T3_9BURK|nr:tripartite tricarboxylate transporter substrate binding protein [Ramlibacter aurantiacus]MBL0420859.1 tripartite tricarboxylate transporter substrate binding protein [Ramlibacter aurantiacus]
MSIRRWIGAAAASFLLCATAQAQYPDRPVRIIVPFAPGGAVDAIARIIAERISGPLGQNVLVENRVGAGSVVGTEAAARAAPDGYTLLMGSASGFMINPLLQTLPYDPMKAFAPVALVGRVPFVIVSSAELPPKDLKQFIEYAKARPGKLAYASAGAGTPHHVAGEMFKQKTGTDLVHVPYKGTAPGILDVVSGRVALMPAEILAALPHVRSGKLRALGIATAARSPVAPDIPTLKEAGLPELEVTTWYGLVAPTGTPPDVLNKLSETVVKALADNEAREKLAKIGVIPGGPAGTEFAAFLREENVKWTKAVKETNVRLE